MNWSHIRHLIIRIRAGRGRFLELDKTGIHVAEYLTVLSPRHELEAKLQRSLLLARQRLDAHEKEEK